MQRATIDLSTPRGLSRPADPERGVVLVWASITVMVIAGLVLAGSTRVEGVERLGNMDFAARGQVSEIARAGLVDAFAWMRRQTSQPVTSFMPARVGVDRPAHLRPPEGGWATPIAPATDGVIVNETDDPDRGLVRAFRLAPGVWARYIIRRGQPPEPFVDADQDGWFDSDEAFTDLDGNGSWTPGWGTRDVTSERGMPGQGSVWLLVCEASIYSRPRLDLPLEQEPNGRLARAVVAREVRRMSIAPPASAAVCGGDVGHLTLGDNVRVRHGGAAAIAWRTDLSGSNTPSVATGAEVDGPMTAIDAYEDRVRDVFGLPLDRLRSMADLSTDDPAQIPSKIPDYGLVVAETDVVFDDERPLRGTGVLVVKGDVVVDDGSNSFFSGILYVDGNVTVRAPAYLRGTVIATGEVDLRGTGGDLLEIEHDPGIINDMLLHMGKYRISKAAYRPRPTLEDGRPDDSHLPDGQGGLPKGVLEGEH